MRGLWQWMAPQLLLPCQPDKHQLKAGSLPCMPCCAQLLTPAACCRQVDQCFDVCCVLCMVKISVSGLLDGELGGAAPLTDVALSSGQREGFGRSNCRDGIRITYLYMML